MLLKRGLELFEINLQVVLDMFLHARKTLNTLSVWKNQTYFLKLQNISNLKRNECSLVDR